MLLLKTLFHKFGRAEDGYFAALFAIMLIALTATGGAAVDFMNVQNARAVVQQVLDNSTLALHEHIQSRSEAWIKGEAQDLMDQVSNLDDITVTIETVEVTQADGKLFMQAKFDVPMYFVSLVGVNTITARIASQVTKKATSQEIVMVLDNSGSMSNQSRMSNLKTAAINATNILLGSVTSTNDVKIGIVPFTSYVNIGTQNSAASWLDIAGRSDIANDNFDNDDDESTPYTGNVNRLSLYAQIGRNWEGCVEARARISTGPDTWLDTDDTAPTGADANTKFVPLFMPDGAINQDNNYMNDYSNACPNDGSGLSFTERQNRLCKYSPTASIWGDPNDDCPATAVLPLTDSSTTVINTINAMNASGGTNIHMGAIWGFRTISPGLPFNEGGDYDVDLSKILIIMTDGENTTGGATWHHNGATWHSAYGYPVNGRLGAVGWTDAQLEAEMDNRTVQSCTSAKNAGVKVYTIGLNPPNQATRDMLTDCATSGSHAHFPTQPSELDSVFQSIANEILAARISQ